MSFAVCAPDPNAGIRMQARIAKQKKDSQYHSESLKYWNRETKYVRGKQRIGRGYSRKKSDQYQMALYALSKGRRQQASLFKDAAAYRFSADQSGVGRSSRYGMAKYQKILAKQAAIEASLDTTFGRNYDAQSQKINRTRAIQIAKNRDALGVRPEYGMPVMMPPKGDTTMANLQFGLGMLGTIASFAALSDIRSKENIEQIGVSPSGYKIYEWNYKHNKKTRFRGVIAQDVVKINPMAVDVLDDGNLAVFYDMIDVNMEVV